MIESMHRRPCKDADEIDVFHHRSDLHWQKRETRKAKQRYNRRTRRAARIELRTMAVA